MADALANSQVDLSQPLRRGNKRRRHARLESEDEADDLNDDDDVPFDRQEEEPEEDEAAVIDARPRSRPRRVQLDEEEDGGYQRPVAAAAAAVDDDEADNEWAHDLKQVEPVVRQEHDDPALFNATNELLSDEDVVRACHARGCAHEGFVFPHVTEGRVQFPCPLMFWSTEHERPDMIHPLEVKPMPLAYMALLTSRFMREDEGARNFQNAVCRNIAVPGPVQQYRDLEAQAPQSVEQRGQQTLRMRLWRTNANMALFVYRVVGIRALLHEVHTAIQTHPQSLSEPLRLAQPDGLLALVEMLQFLDAPFDHLNSGSGPRDLPVRMVIDTAADAYKNTLRLPPARQAEFRSAVARCNYVLSDNVGWPDTSRSTLAQRLVRLSDRDQRLQHLVEQYRNPPPARSSVVIDDKDKRWPIVIEVLRRLQDAGVILVDRKDPARLMFATPEYTEDGTFKYTYGEPSELHEVLSSCRLSMEESYAFGTVKSTVMSTIASFHEQSTSVPYSPDTFVHEQRFIRFKNGFLDCRTALFYVERVDFDVPHTWPFRASDLQEFVGSGKRIRVMSYQDFDLQYFRALRFMLKGAYAHTQCGEAFSQRLYKLHTETVETVQLPAFPGEVDEEGQVPLTAEESQVAHAAMDEWIEEQMLTAHEWIHNPDRLRELDPTFVPMMSLQKIAHNQRWDWATYRFFLMANGRALSGILCGQTRLSPSHRFLEERLNRRIVDKREFSISLEGIGGTGKSTALRMCVDQWIQPSFIGEMANERRPIAAIEHLLDKAVILARDMQKENGQAPANGGDVKKIISTEPTVVGRLYRQSVVRIFTAMMILAMNDPFPWADVKGDFFRRVLFFFYDVLIGEHNMYFRDDNRTLQQVWEQEDQRMYPAVAAIANLRSLLNVGGHNIYMTPRSDPDFRVPDYLLRTRTVFSRGHNSFRAMLMELMAQGKINFAERFRTYYTPLASIKQVYERYVTRTNSKACDEATLSATLRDFNLRVDRGVGDQLIVYGMEFCSFSVEDPDATVQQKDWGRSAEFTFEEDGPPSAAVSAAHDSGSGPAAAAAAAAADVGNGLDLFAQLAEDAMPEDDAPL